MSGGRCGGARCRGVRRSGSEKRACSWTREQLQLECSYTPQATPITSGIIKLQTILLQTTMRGRNDEEGGTGEERPGRVTSLTLLAQAVGLVAVLWHWSVGVMLVPVVLLPKWRNIVPGHSWRTIAELTITTYIFGIVDGISLQSIMEYVQGGYAGSMPLLEMYLILLTIYHYFQFEMVNCFHHRTLNWHSFLLYHSKPYMIANTFMFLEHLITKYFFQFAYKEQNPLALLGLCVMVTGQGLRVAAFFTCRHNFTHLVRFRKVAGHQLVTNGVYSIFRHPSYTGYFYFSLGGQILLGNAISTILFAIVLTRFFKDRIHDEQLALTRFFPEYKEYQARTWICVPGVKGADLTLAGGHWEWQD